LKEFRGVTNAFSIGSGTIVVSIPKEIVNEIKIDTEKKKSYFNIYTEYSSDGATKRIVYEFTKHAKRKNKKE